MSQESCYDVDIYDLSGNKLSSSFHISSDETIYTIKQKISEVVGCTVSEIVVCVDDKIYENASLTIGLSWKNSIIQVILHTNNNCDYRPFLTSSLSTIITDRYLNMTYSDGILTETLLTRSAFHYKRSTVNPDEQTPPFVNIFEPRVVHKDISFENKISPTGIYVLEIIRGRLIQCTIRNMTTKNVSRIRFEFFHTSSDYSFSTEEDKLFILTFDDSKNCFVHEFRVVDGSHIQTQKLITFEHDFYLKMEGIRENEKIIVANDAVLLFDEVYSLQRQYNADENKCIFDSKRSNDNSYIHLLFRPLYSGSSAATLTYVALCTHTLSVLCTYEMPFSSHVTTFSADDRFIFFLSNRDTVINFWDIHSKTIAGTIKLLHETIMIQCIGPYISATSIVEKKPLVVWVGVA